MTSELILPPGPLERLSPIGMAPLEDAGVEIEWRRLISAAYRNRVAIVATIGLALIIGVIVTMLSPRIYKAASSVQIEQVSSNVLGSGSEQLEPAAGATDVDLFLQTQVDIINSRSVAERVAESLGLYADDRFILAMGGKTTGRTVSDRNAVADRRKAVDNLLLKNLIVNLPRNTRIASIGFTSPDPNVAQRVADAYAQSYIASNLQRRFDASSYARAFLEQQLDLTKTRLETSERAMIAYARQAGLLDTSSGMAASSAPGGQGVAASSGAQSLTTSDLVQVNNAYIAARSARIDAEQRWSQAQATPLMSLPEVLSNPAISSLVQQRATLKAAYDQDLQRRKADFPTMKQNLAQIEALDEQIQELANNLKNSIRDQYNTALKQEKSLGSNVSELKATTLSEQDRSVQYNILKRETDTNRSLYDALLQRYKEVSAEAGVSANNLSILDRAIVPTAPVRPRPLVNMGIALLLGTLIAAAIVFFRERLDDAIRSPEDLTEKLGLPFLSSIPQFNLGSSAGVELANPRSAFSESYYSLRATLQLASAAGTPRSLLFTSSHGAEGKSTTAMAVARSFAQIGLKVLLIDGDLRRPSLHRVFGISNDAGLSTMLTGHHNIEFTTQPTEHSNLYFIPAGPLPPNPTLLLSGPALGHIIEQACSKYDILMIDGPPLLGMADAVLYGVAVEATVFIVEAGRNNPGAGKAALRRLLSSGANVIGTVLTKFDAKGSGYAKYYDSYYSYSSASQPEIE